jgi:hypothetical protein
VEVVQQPHHVEGLPSFGGVPVTIPTSLSYFVRLVPHLKGSPLQLDFGVVQLAGKVAPTLNLEARARVAMGVSYHF